MTKHKFNVNTNVNKEIDQILSRTKFSSLQEYLEWRIKTDNLYLKKNPNKSIG